MSQNKLERFFYALDLEMEQPSNEIISIGVAYQNVDYDSEVDIESRTVTHYPVKNIVRKNFLITPSQPISPFIQELTGLKDDMFDWSKTRKQCFQEFVDFHEERANQIKMLVPDSVMHHEAVVWGSGDVPLLRSQLAAAGVEYSFINKRFIDTKTLVMLYRLSNMKSISGRMSLKSGLGEFGITFEGSAHDSSWDAYNTLKLFEAYNWKMSTVFNLIKTIKGM